MLSYDNWESGQPNNHHEQDCVALYKGNWRDDPCGNAQSYICESIP